jgi:N-acetylglucosamine malate deacetylase 1
LKRWVKGTFLVKQKESFIIFFKNCGFNASILLVFMKNNFKKIDILAIGAHPDDVELSAAGTLLKHAALGKTFGLLDLTRGELGSRGTAEIRAEESANSAQLLGADFRETLNLGDGRFEWNQTNLRQIMRIIRRFRPEIVFCNAPEDRHPDHGRAAKLEVDACFFSGLMKLETFEDDGTPQQIWRPKAVYHYIQDQQLTPDFVVDISPFLDQKMAAILTFRSQFFEENMNGPKTPISGEDFLDFMKAKMRVFGRPIGAKYAEGFIKSRVFGVENLFHLV